MSFAPHTPLSQDTSFFYRVLALQGRRGYGLDIGLGALAVLGHAPFHFWILSLMSLALLKLRLDMAVHLAEGDNSKESFLQNVKSLKRRGFYIAGRYGFGYFLFGLFWIGSAFIARGPAFIPLMPPMILGLALLLALFWAVAGRLYAGMRLSAWPSVAAFTALFFLAELARGHVLSGLPWNLTGYIFPAGGPMSQIAAYIGIYGLTCLVLLISAGLSLGLAFGLKSLPSARIWQAPLLSLGVVGGLVGGLLGGLFVYGHMRLSTAQTQYVEDVKLRIVQVPFNQADKFDDQKSIDIVNSFIAVSLDAGLEDITHIVWPEGAVNGLAIENQALMTVFSQALIERSSSPPVWLLQSLRRQQTSLEDGQLLDTYYTSSAAIEFDPSGRYRLAAYNDKTKLVPFGEFIPGGRLAQRLGLKSLSTALASLSAADVKTNSDYPGLPRVSPQICYEIIFPGVTPRKDPNPAQWILNQSNDAWYGRSIGPAQHFNQARYRALEEGLPIVRAASNGVSGIIDSYGRALKTADAREKIALDVKLPRPITLKSDINTVTFFLFLINLVISILCWKIRRVRQT